MLAARPHDLVQLDDPAAVLTGAEPGWVARALTAAPWAVIRRAPALAGHLAVGVRGAARHERQALQIPTNAVVRLARPEDLRPGQGCATYRTPALAALHRCQPILDTLAHPWGPTGSTGFELATGHLTTTSDSDLDLLLRVDALPSQAWAADLVDRLSVLPTRVDCQLETPTGAVALAELATGADTILLRSDDGPRLVALDHPATT